jgi:ABC-type glycerol-3-phosphate transport system substrate-binding protein
VSNWTGSEGEAFQAVIDGFQQKNPKVTVKVEQVPFDQTQALLTQQFAAGRRRTWPWPCPASSGPSPARTC